MCIAQGELAYLREVQDEDERRFGAFVDSPRTLAAGRDYIAPTLSYEKWVLDARG